LLLQSTIWRNNLAVSIKYYTEKFSPTQPPAKEVTVTNTVGEYRKLAQADDNPGEYHIYQDSPEPERIKAACMPGQDLSMVSTNPLNPIAISPPTQLPAKENDRPSSVVLFYTGFEIITR